MSDVPNPTGRTGLRRLLPTWRTAIGSALVVALLGIGAFFVGYTLVSIPDPNAAAVAQNNVYLYADGTELARDGAVNRQNVPLSEIARTARYAVLAAEDRNFYHESAVNPKAMLRAAWNSATGKGLQSGSTITQQYVKNYYLNQNQTAKRKVKEFFIAIKLDRNQTKDQILDGYLNTSYFGRNAYGIQAASRAYFDQDAARLTTAQGAYLATLLNAPSEYDLAVHPDNAAAARRRWNYVLDGMVKEGWLTPAERAVTHFPEISKPKPVASKAGQRGYIVEAVDQYLIDHHILDSDALAAGGYRVTTTIQRSKENALTAAAQDNVYDKRTDTAAGRALHAGGVSIDPATGDVVALYGGVDYTRQYVSSATNRTYQPGSTFKPVILASALQNGSQTQDGEPITPDTVYNGDDKRPVQGPDGPVGYAPENEDHVDYGDITVTRAMDKSVNAVFAQMAQDVGTAKVIDTAHDLGMPDLVDIPETPAMALGAFGEHSASPLDMAQVYATLAAHGRQTPYSLVLKITRDGDDIGLPDRHPVQTVPREAVDTTTAVLRSVVDSPGGTAAVAQDSGRPAAAKTGTADGDLAAWFAGYTPRLATVVALLGIEPEHGAQVPLTGSIRGLGRINGGGPPGQVWAQYTADALNGTPATDFDLQTQDDITTDQPSTDPTTDQSSTEPDTTAPSTGPTDTPPGPPTDTPPGPPTDTPPTTEPAPTDTMLPSGGTIGGSGPGGGTSTGGDTGTTGGTGTVGGVDTTGGTGGTAVGGDTTGTGTAAGQSGGDPAAVGQGAPPQP